MALSSTYGMGVYNARTPEVDLKLPKIAGGVATPLAFFPPTKPAAVDPTKSVDTSLQDVISRQGSRNGATVGGAGVSVGGVSDRSSGTGVETGTTLGGNVIGFGLPDAVAVPAGMAISTGLSLAGVPGVVSSVFGKVGKGLLGEGMTDTDMANIAINTAMVALGVPGIAMTALNALGFNPAQGLGEAFGMYEGLTPGFEGGFFGGQGIGSGLTLGEAVGVGQLNSGAGVSGESGGSGVSVGSGGGISYGGGGGGWGGGGGPTGGTPGYGSGDLGSGISAGAGGGINVGGNFGGGDSDSSSGSGGGGGGGNKIVCTAMNHTYGFGSFRNAIWLAYAANNLTPYHEKGYHAIFQPLVKYGFYSGESKTKLLVRKCLEWYARRRSTDLRKEMRGKNPTPIFRLVRRFSELICYLVGRCVYSASDNKAK